MAKIVCVLYDDPIDRYPTVYARDGLPKIDHYPGGQTVPTPKAIDFQPGTLLGSVSGNSACANTWKASAINWWLLPTRMVPTVRLSAN